MKLLGTVNDWLTWLTAQWMRLRPHLAASWRIACNTGGRSGYRRIPCTLSPRR